MKNPFKFISAFLIVGISLVGCQKDDHEEKLDTEIRLLDQFVIEKDYGVEARTSGLYYIEEIPGTGAQPEVGDFVLVNFTGRMVQGERVFATTDYWVAEENNLVSSSFLYGPFRLEVGNIAPAGMNEGVQYMKEGGFSKLIFPSTLGFGRYPIGILPAYSSLIYDVELLEVIPDPVVYETELLSQYISDNMIEVEPDTAGVYYIELVEGTGQSPLNNNIVEVTYTAYLLDGRMIASTGSTVKQLSLTGYLQGYINEYYTVKGLRDAIKKMKPGGVATVIIPYTQAFGSSSVDASSLGYKYPVPAYSTLVYEIELKAIK
jgi:FKBP-type peptidyl-prolyl cis-trans isomerase